MSPSLHQTPVNPGFQRDDHTPHLARGEGISSEMGQEGKKGEKRREGWKGERKEGGGEKGSWFYRLWGSRSHDFSITGDPRTCHCVSIFPGVRSDRRTMQPDSHVPEWFYHPSKGTEHQMQVSKRKGPQAGLWGRLSALVIVTGLASTPSEKTKSPV